VRAWWLITVIAGAGIVLGMVFLFSPQTGITALIVTLSIFIAVVGLALIWVGSRLRALESRMAADPRFTRRDDGGGETIRGEVIE